MAFEALKNFYYSLEEKWYNLLDKIDAHVPIYRVIEPIDKVVPSFALFLLLLAVLLAFGVSTLLGGAPSGQGTFSIQAVDLESNQPVENANYTLNYEGLEEALSGTTDEQGFSQSVTVPLGTIVQVSVERDNYQTIELIEQEVTQPGQVLSVRLEQLLTAETISFFVKDSAGRLVTDVPLTVTFTCSTGERAPASIVNELQPRSGFEVEKTSNCGQLRASVEGKGYQALFQEPVSDGESLPLTQDIPSAGIVLVNLFTTDDAGNETGVNQSVAVKLYRMDNGMRECPGVYDTTEYASGGQARFEEVSTGSYCVEAEGTGQFARKESNVSAVNEGETASVSLTLERSIVGRVRVQVVDERSRVLEGAAVKLFKGTSQEGYATTSRDDNGILNFPVDQASGWTLTISKEGYKPYNAQVEASETPLRIRLEQCRGSECATLSAKVVTAEGKPIYNAVAGLFTEEGFATPLPQKVSDVNGNVKFAPVSNGTYKVFAYKGLASGWSDPQEFRREKASEILYTVTLDIPKTTVRVQAIDEDENPIPFALIAIRDAFTKEEIQGFTPADNNGTKLFENISVGTKVYVMVRASDPARRITYADFISNPVELKLDQEAFVLARMEMEIISGEIEAKFLGIYKDGQNVTNVAPGEEYIARFQVKLPNTDKYKNNLTETGLHVRTNFAQGTTSVRNRMETDAWYVKDVLAPGVPSVTRGVSFTENASAALKDEELQALSSQGSKWVNVVYLMNNAPSRFTGLVNVDVVVKVKNTAVSGEALSLEWFSWAKVAGETHLVPAQSAVFAGTEDMYNIAPNAENFVVGEEQLCSDVWCFSATVQDLESNLIESAQNGFDGTLGKDYRLKFSILNTSESERDSFYNAELQLRDVSESAVIKQYKFTDVTNTSVPNPNGTPQTLNGYDTGFKAIGSLTPKTRVSGEFDVLLEKNNTAQFNLQVKSNNRIVYSKTLNVRALSREEFKLEFQRENNEFTEQAPLLPTGVENDLVIKVKNARTNLEVKEARVSLKNKFGNTLYTGSLTNDFGVTTLKVPAIPPGETLTVLVTKPDYQTLEAQVSSDNKVLTHTPERLGVSLNVKTQKENTQTLALTNATDFELTVTGIELKGNFRELIDESKAQDFLFTQFAGQRISAKGALDVDVRLALSEVGLQLKQNEALEGELVITANGLNSDWIVKVPVVVSIGIGGEVDNPTCFNLSKSTWMASTEGQPATLQVRFENNCTVNGIPVELRNLEAQVEWKGNKLGNYAVSIGSDTIELRESYYKLIRPRVLADEQLEGTITFTPDGGVNGLAEATVLVKAENPTANGVQELTDSLSTQLGVTNLQQCIIFSRDLFKVVRGGEENFDVETKNCGAQVEFKFLTDLDLSKKTAILQGTDKQQFQIVTDPEQIAGQYSINVQAKGAGFTDFRDIQTLRVRVLGGECFELSRYEFDVYNDPVLQFDGFDTAKLINKCVKKRQTMTVHFDEFCVGFGIDDQGPGGANLSEKIRNQVKHCVFPKILFGAAIGGIVGGLGSLGKGGAAAAAGLSAVELAEINNEGECEEKGGAWAESERKCLKEDDQCSSDEDCGPGLKCKSYVTNAAGNIPFVSSAGRVNVCVDEKTGEVADNKQALTGKECTTAQDCVNTYGSAGWVCNEKNECLLEGKSAAETAKEKVKAKNCITQDKQIYTPNQTVTRACINNKIISGVCNGEAGIIHKKTASGWEGATIIETCTTEQTCQNGTCVTITGGTAAGTCTGPAKADGSTRYNINEFYTQCKSDNTKLYTNTCKSGGGFTETEVPCGTGTCQVVNGIAQCSASAPPAAGGAAHSDTTAEQCTDPGNCSYPITFQTTDNGVWTRARTTEGYVYYSQGTSGAYTTPCVFNSSGARIGFIGIDDVVHFHDPTNGWPTNDPKCVPQLNKIVSPAPSTQPLATDVSSGLAALLTPTGQAVAGQQQGYAQQPFGLGGIQQGLGNMVGGLGNAIGGVGNLIGAGFTSPAYGAGIGALVGLYDGFFNAEAGDVTLTNIILDDLNPVKYTDIEVKLVEGVTPILPGEIPPQRVAVQDVLLEGIDLNVGTSRERVNPADPQVPLKVTDISFYNTGRKRDGTMGEPRKQKDPYTPIVGVLKVGGQGVRLEYCNLVHPESKEEGNLEQMEKLLELDAVNKSEDSDEDKVRKVCQNKVFSKEEVTQAFAQDKVKNVADYFEQIRLQFNAWKGKDANVVPTQVESCRIGSRIGATGPNAKPRVLFKWKYADIDFDRQTGIAACDELKTMQTEDGKTVPGYVYCDSTQFTIELLKKTLEIDRQLRDKEISCPAAGDVLANASAELSSLERDIAITGLSASQLTGDNAERTLKVKVDLQSNNDANVRVPVTLTVTNKDTGTEVPGITPKQVELLSRASVEFEVSDLEVSGNQEVYEFNVTIGEFQASTGRATNGDESNDELKITVTLVEENGRIVGTKCEPYNTKRLSELAQVQSNASQGLDKVVKLVTFNANLIEDGYSEDFRNDLTEYASTKGAFGLGASNTELTNLMVGYFKNPNKWKFKSPFLSAPNQPLRAGKYKVTIGITYDSDSRWDLQLNEPVVTTTAGGADATLPSGQRVHIGGMEVVLARGLAENNTVIEIELERLQGPEPDSPFYYMPLDGLVGVDSENGRQGYGINFRQESEQAIKFNEAETLEDVVRSNNVPGSNPIPNGWVIAGLEQDFKKINTDQATRGLVLDVERATVQQQINVKLAPSKATPVVLKMLGGKAENAFAYYNLTVSGQPQVVGDNLTYWTGLGRRCKDFTDRELTTGFLDTPDIHAGVGVAKCSGAGLSTSNYGLEFCGVKRTGNVYLGTVIFTPQSAGEDNILTLVDGQDEGTTLLKPGANTAENAANAYESTRALTIGGEGSFGGDIDSIEDVLNRIANREICVQGLGNSAKQTYYWNPQAILRDTRTYGSLMTALGEIDVESSQPLEGTPDAAPEEGLCIN